MKLSVEEVTSEVVSRMVDDFSDASPELWERWLELERLNEPIDEVHGKICLFIKDKVVTRNLRDLSRLVMLLREDAAKRITS